MKLHPDELKTKKKCFSIINNLRTGEKKCVLVPRQKKQSVHMSVEKMVQLKKLLLHWARENPMEWKEPENSL